jgi:hypothetical protein
MKNLTRKFKSYILVAILLLSFVSLRAQADSTKVFEVYGFAMLDIGYNANQVKPSWYDAMRPSRLPSYENQYGADGFAYASARQSRFGVKTSFPTSMGNFKAVFDIDMYGVGADEGQTTIRLRHAYGQLGHWGAGLTESAFMDLDVFPNTTEYWGPNGMLFLRNAQVRWESLNGLVIALEAPGASGDAGIYADRVELQGVKVHFPMPDLSGHYRWTGNNLYLQLGGIVRYFKWDDQNATPTLDLSGNATGWGVSLSTGINLGKKILIHGQGSYGAGVENYFNDAPIDVGIASNNDPKTPVTGEPLTDVGLVGFVDINWSPKWTSSVGYSTTIITNSDGQAPDAYKQGQYIAANLMYYPVSGVMTGIELNWIDRQNNSDGFTSSATRVNFSFKYNFSYKHYGM